MKQNFVHIEIELPPIDLRRLQMVAETEQEKATLLTFFFDVADDVVDDMEKATRFDAMTQWKDAAHKLRGAAANIGMAMLEKLCLDAEKIDGMQAQARAALLMDIRNEIEHVKLYIAEKAPFLLTPGI